MPDFTLTPVEEQDVLTYDPWGDDSNYRVIKSKFIVTRKPQECSICFGEIPVKSRVWIRVEVLDTIKTFYFCPECCWCIAHRYDDDNDLGFERLYARFDLGAARAARSRISSMQ